ASACCSTAMICSSRVPLPCHRQSPFLVFSRTKLPQITPISFAPNFRFWVTPHCALERAGRVSVAATLNQRRARICCVHSKRPTQYKRAESDLQRIQGSPLQIVHNDQAAGSYTCRSDQVSGSFSTVHPGSDIVVLHSPSCAPSVAPMRLAARSAGAYGIC